MMILYVCMLVVQDNFVYTIDIICLGDNTVKIKDATVLRIQDLCRDREITLYRLAQLSGVSTKPLYGLLRKERQDMSLSLLKKIVDGLDMTMAEFFDSKIFNGLNLEIE